MTENTLFQEPEPAPLRTETCRSCAHRQRWFNYDGRGKPNQYCGIFQSRRTKTGLKKIKCTDIACKEFKEEAGLGMVLSDQSKKTPGRGKK